MIAFFGDQTLLLVTQSTVWHPKMHALKTSIVRFWVSQAIKPIRYTAAPEERA